jgi:hypothetical protein
VNAQSTPFNVTGAIHIDRPFGICHGSAHTIPEAQMLANQGVQINRFDIYWHDIERTPGILNYTRMDIFVNNLLSVGIEPLALLLYGNPYLFGEENAVYVAPNHKTAWFNYVNTTVRRYQSQIKYWELWNEPNLDVFWSGPDQEFFELLEETAEFVQNINNSLILVSPGISGSDPPYLRKLIAEIGEDDFNRLFDVMAFHPYSGATAELVDLRCAEIRQIAEEIQFPGEIWITEVGYGSPEGREEWTYDAGEVIKSIMIPIQHNISRIIWYSYRDPSFGLQFYNSTTGWNNRPAGYTYQFLSQTLTNSTFYPNGINLRTNWAVPSNLIWKYYFYTSDGKIILALWSQSTATKFTVVIPSETMDFHIYQFDSWNNRTVFLGEKSCTPEIGSIPQILILSNDSSRFEPVEVQIAIDFSDRDWVFFGFVGVGFLCGVSLIILRKSKIIR